MDDEDYALSQLLRDAVSPSPCVTSLATSPAPKPLPKVQRRPISKRRGKKRSSRACSACRARKVRCNIVAHGAPCSNCRHDEVECFLPLSRRQKAARERMEREQKEQSTRESIFSVDVGDTVIQTMEIEAAAEEELQKPLRTSTFLLERAQSAPNAPQLAPRGMAISEHPLAEILKVASLIPQQAQTLLPSSISPRTKSWIQIASPLASVQVPRASSQLSILPGIFAPFPRHLDAYDLTYLHSRGALTLPSEILQIALLKAYIEFVHPSLPLLDLEKFLSVVKYGLGGSEGEKGKSIERENMGKNQIHLLLFQAVMFAGVEFASLKTLKQAGYKTREAAKQAFFGRVKLLYDFDTSTDRLSIIQSLLLMTFSPPSSHDMKDSWHWLGLAISLSYSLGLHRRSLQQNTNMRRKHLERRVWWAAFIRDRSLALEGGASWRKPMRIKREDCDVEMLSLEDFELVSENACSEDLIEEIKLRKNAEAFVEKAKLCWCCDQVLVSTFSATWAQTLPTSLTLPRNASNLQQCEKVPKIYTGELETPAFESQEDVEYHIAPSSSSPSAQEDCVTPRDLEDEDMEDDIFEGISTCSSPLGAGYGVDGEYDDYLEFLKGPVIREHPLKGKERSNWAFQLDCDNDRIMEV